jgi:hypothetical protein
MGESPDGDTGQEQQGGLAAAIVCAPAAHPLAKH